jgi:hypothetical protein
MTNIDSATYNGYSHELNPSFEVRKHWFVVLLIPGYKSKDEWPQEAKYSSQLKPTSTFSKFYKL